MNNEDEQFTKGPPTRRTASTFLHVVLYPAVVPRQRRSPEIRQRKMNQPLQKWLCNTSGIQRRSSSSSCGWQSSLALSNSNFLGFKTRSLLLQNLSSPSSFVQQKMSSVAAKRNPRPMSQRTLFIVSAALATMAYSMYKYSYAANNNSDIATTNKTSSPAQCPDSDRQRVERRLKLHGLEMKKEIKGDGNCQFRALSDQLYDTEDEHRAVRSDVTNWMRSNGQSTTLANGEVMANFLDTETFPSWDSYCGHMSKNGVWGDHFTLTAAAENYGARVHVLSSVAGDDKSALSILEPATKKPQKNLYLLNWHDSHFDSLQPASKKPEKG